MSATTTRIAAPDITARRTLILLPDARNNSEPVIIDLMEGLNTLDNTTLAYVLHSQVSKLLAMMIYTQ
jgi:hypothetical protein